MMAITLDVRQPEQIDQCEILLHSQPGLGGEILTGHEVALAAGLGVAHSAAGGVEDGFVEPLAAFARHSGVAEVAGRWEGAELGVGLVEPALRHRASRTARSIWAGPKLATSGLRPRAAPTTICWS